VLFIDLNASEDPIDLIAIPSAIELDRKIEIKPDVNSMMENISANAGNKTHENSSQATTTAGTYNKVQGPSRVDIHDTEVHMLVDPRHHAFVRDLQKTKDSESELSGMSSPQKYTHPAG